MQNKNSSMSVANQGTWYEFSVPKTLITIFFPDLKTKYLVFYGGDSCKLGLFNYVDNHYPEGLQNQRGIRVTQPTTTTYTLPLNISPTYFLLYDTVNLNCHFPQMPEPS